MVSYVISDFFSLRKVFANLFGFVKAPIPEASMLISSSKSSSLRMANIKS